MQRRVALVHDFLVSVRGADRVFLEMCDLYPDADIFTPIYNEKGIGGALAGRQVNTSFLQRLRPTARTFRALLPLYPAAIESFDLSGYDLVVSSSSAWAHAVICDENAVHVSYCHNPFRYVWNERHRTLAERGNPVTRSVLGGLFRRWREWDWIASQRVDRFVTNSRTTQQRIRTYLGRESRVVYPPVDTHRLKPGTVGDHYLVLSELVSHKRLEVAVEAFNRLGQPLVVVGGGPERRRLAALAGPSITFTGRAPDSHVEQLLASCKALVVPSVEEFGIAAVEAQAAGRPVLAAGSGGAIETVVDGVTGHLWKGGPDELEAAVRAFDTDAVDPQACIDNARRFDTSVFRREFPREVEAAFRDRERRNEGPDQRPEAIRRPPRRRGGLVRPLR
jgi:glycosyltransferase involved in cell wall biosynthesis